jgi:hypothetical protein
MSSQISSPSADILCSLCKNAEDSLKHIFLSCIYALGCLEGILLALRHPCSQDHQHDWVGLHHYLYASIGYGDVGELEGTKGQPGDGANLDNGSVVLNVVSLEGTECT